MKTIGELAETIVLRHANTPSRQAAARDANKRRVVVEDEREPMEARNGR